MPIHRVPAASLHEDLEDIQRRQGERVISITSDPLAPAFFVVRTEYLDIETRPHMIEVPLDVVDDIKDGAA